MFPFVDIWSMHDLWTALVNWLEQSKLKFFWLRNCLSYVCLFSYHYLTSYLKNSVFIVMAEQVIKNLSHRIESQVWQKTYAALNFKTLGLTIELINFHYVTSTNIFLHPRPYNSFFHWCCWYPSLELDKKMVIILL